jgi:hypothetical protein
MIEIQYGSHRAILDPLTGHGALVCPTPTEDVKDPMPVSALTLYEAEWDAAVTDLYLRGWEPLDGFDDLPLVAGVSRHGGLVIGLYGRQSIITEPTFDELVAADVMVAERAG